MKNKSNHALVGIFSLGALVLLLGFTVFTGGFSSLRDENERFVTKYSFLCRVRIFISDRASDQERLLDLARVS